MKHARDILNERLSELTRLMRRYRDDAEWAAYMGKGIELAWKVESEEVIAALRVLNGEVEP